MSVGIVGVRVRRGAHVFHVHGEHAGREGVWLAKDQVDGIYDAPVKTTYKSGAFTEGSRYKHTKRLHRDMELGFHTIETITDTYEFNESQFRQAFAYEPDRWSTDPDATVIEIETDISGVRKIDVLMYEAPEFSAAVDPIMQQYGNAIFKLRAGDPMWYEDNVVDTYTAETASGSGWVTVENPTDQVMYHKWILTRGTWDLPDFQWVGDPGERIPGGPNADRIISDIVVTETNGAAIIDLDPAELMWRDPEDTNLQAQMGGIIFNYAIPPYTPKTDLPVAYSDAPAGGAMAQLVMPRRWSRPYGLEAQTILAPNVARSIITRFTSPGTFTYEIPPWATTLDVVIIGGGGGGGGGSLIPGFGGGPGEWETATLVRGAEIPADTTTITGTVGAGGLGGFPLLPWDGGNGGTTSAAATGWAGITAAGGDGSADLLEIGVGVTGITFNGIPYPGSWPALIPGQVGNTPGGGGAGGWPLWFGGEGARGQVWIRAYTEGGS
jgi:hypothetical protein